VSAEASLTRSRTHAPFAVLCVFVIAILAGSPAVAVGKSAGVVPIEMANNQCSVTISPTTCGGAYTPTTTFSQNLSVNELVTVAFAYLYGDNESAVLNFSDSLGNTPVVVSSGCSIASPIVCTATGYYYVSFAGPDDILFTERGGSTGEMWYNAEIWTGPIGHHLSSTGANSYCALSCTGSVSLGPLTNSSGTNGIIAVSAYVAFYSSTPATWQPSMFYTYSLTDSNPNGGDSVLWQGSSTISGSYSFSATTSPVPNTWGGSSELIYWIH